MSTTLIDKLTALVDSGEASRSGLARAAGLHPNSLRKLGSSDWNPTADTLVRLEKLIDGGVQDVLVGAEAIIDFVGENGAVEDGVGMVRDGGFYYVIGYGQNIDIPTIDVISREISFIGNLVGTYVDLEDLMTLTAQGQVTLHTSTYPLDAINDAMADLDNGRLQGRGILIPAGAA